MGDEVEETMEFLVVLYNGERQIKVGSINIHPTLNFRQFRTILTEMIGVSYNNLTAYLVESYRTEIPLEKRKHLITSKVDFSTFGHKNGYFLVVLKRSRKERRTKKQAGLELPLMDLFDIRVSHREIVSQIPAPGKAELWLQELEMQRARNLNYPTQNQNPNEDDLCTNTDANNFPSIKEAYPASERTIIRALCPDCTKASRKGLKPEFHCCVYDEVVKGYFKSPAGPIDRPKTVSGNAVYSID